MCALGFLFSALVSRRLVVYHEAEKEAIAKGVRVKKIAIVGGGASGLAAAVAASEHLRVVNAQGGTPAAGACGGKGAAGVRGGARSAAAQDVARPANEGHVARPANGGCGSAPSDSCEVVVYEADDRVGRSILATGNGRCNFSNAHVGEGDFRNADFVGDALIALRGHHVAHSGKCTVRVMEEDPVCEFFAERGLAWREEDDGRRYPATNKASAVLDVLRAAAAAGGVREECAHGVVAIEAPRGRVAEGVDTSSMRPAEVAGASRGRVAEVAEALHAESGRFTLRMDDGEFVRADAVILACGGRAGLGAGVGGHSALELAPAGFGFSAQKARPVLGPLKTDTGAIRGLDGVRVRCAVELVREGKRVARERGELLFRSYGVSGIAVFDLSRHARAGDEVVIDFLPNVRECDMQTFIGTRRKRMARHRMVATCEDFLRGLVLPSVARAALAHAGVSAGAQAGKEELAQVAAALKRFPLKIQGVGDARQCQVARGGLAIKSFDPCTMEARALPGFFAVGEALDVDARCGGFNLHWAWASGILAGLAAAEHVAGAVRRS